MRTVRAALLMTLTAALAACGFHLREAPYLPPQMRVIYVAAPGGSSDLVRELRRNLASDNTEVVLDPTNATATLSILHASQSTRPLTFNNLGRAIEYEVAYEVEFSMMAGGVVIIPPQKLALSRSYNFSTSNAVGNEEQSDVEYAALTHEMARLILFRIQAAARSLTPPASTVPAPAGATAKPVPAPAASSPATGTVTLSPSATTAPAPAT